MAMIVFMAVFFHKTTENKSHPKKSEKICLMNRGKIIMTLFCIVSDEELIN